MTHYREQIVNFGDSQQLLGILTEPADVAAQGKVVLMLNAGMLHRAGPFRLHTDLARLLAANGFSSFRFDFSGIGDSRSQGSELPADQRCIAEVSQALDELENRLQAPSAAPCQFVAMGLCTGADNAHRSTASDERLSGVICIDGYAYPTGQFYYQKLLQRAGRLVKNPQRIFKLFRRFTLPAPADSDDRADGLFRWHLPAKDRTIAEWEKMTARGVNMLYVYTGSGMMTYSYRQQFFDAAPSLRNAADQISIILQPDADHTFTLSRSRHQLCKNILHWLQEKPVEQ